MLFDGFWVWRIVKSSATFPREYTLAEQDLVRSKMEPDEMLMWTAKPQPRFFWEGRWARSLLSVFIIVEELVMLLLLTPLGLSFAFSNFTTTKTCGFLDVENPLNVEQLVKLCAEQGRAFSGQEYSAENSSSREYGSTSSMRYEMNDKPLAEGFLDMPRLDEPLAVLAKIQSALVS